MGEVRVTGDVRAELNPAHHGDDWREGGERRLYRVTEAAARPESFESRGSEGLFKNGRIYRPGETIELNVASAQASLELGEIEEAE
jgi:hypothetical protein